MKIKSEHTNVDNENIQEMKDPQHGPKPVSKEDIQKLIPNAPDNMLDLLLSQFVNSSKPANGRRWSKDIIRSVWN